jgi:hypothetical protein
MKKVIIGAAAFLAVTASAAQAEDLTFTLINRSSADVVAFYVNHSASDDWGANLFGGNYLPSGNKIDVIINDGRTTCKYDIRAEFRDGDKFEDHNLNMCELGSYTFK